MTQYNGYTLSAPYDLEGGYKARVFKYSPLTKLELPQVYETPEQSLAAAQAWVDAVIAAKGQAVGA